MEGIVPSSKDIILKFIDTIYCKILNLINKRSFAIEYVPKNHEIVITF